MSAQYDSAPISEELSRLGGEVPGIIDQARLIHDCVLRLKPDVVIVDSESPSRDTLENLATLNAQMPRPVVGHQSRRRRQCLRGFFGVSGAAATYDDASIETIR